MARFSLELLNQRHALAHADAVPGGLRDLVDADTYAKSVEYTLAKSRLGQVEDSWNTLVLLAALFLLVLVHLVLVRCLTGLVKLNSLVGLTTPRACTAGQGV